MADESLEGTRVRFQNVVVASAPDEDGVWTISDATGTATIVGVDTYDPSMNEDFPTARRRATSTTSMAPSARFGEA